MTLTELADELVEIRRYVRPDPEYVRERSEAIDGMAIDARPSLELYGLLSRLKQNTDVGLSRILCNPEILEGYLYGAAAEIRELAEREEAGK